MTTSRRRRYVQNVTDLSDGALRCHAFGHAWDISPVGRLSPVGREVWTLRLRCPSCSKIRVDRVTPGTYELEERYYTRPDGFSVAEPADRSDFREEVVRRLRLAGAIAEPAEAGQ